MRENFSVLLFEIFTYNFLKIFKWTQSDLSIISKFLGLLYPYIYSLTRWFFLVNIPYPEKNESLKLFYSKLHCDFRCNNAPWDCMRWVWWRGWSCWRRSRACCRVPSAPHSPPPSRPGPLCVSRAATPRAPPPNPKKWSRPSLEKQS